MWRKHISFVLLTSTRKVWLPKLEVSQQAWNSSGENDRQQIKLRVRHCIRNYLCSLCPYFCACGSWKLDLAIPLELLHHLQDVPAPAAVWCLMPRGIKTRQQTQQRVDFELVIEAARQKKVSMHISGYHERELLIALVLRWRLWGLGLLPVTKQWSAQWGEAPGRSIACWRGAYADSHLHPVPGRQHRTYLAPRSRSDTDLNSSPWRSKEPRNLQGSGPNSGNVHFGAMSEMKPASSWKGHCTW